MRLQTYTIKKEGFESPLWRVYWGALPLEK